MDWQSALTTLGGLALVGVAIPMAQSLRTKFLSREKTLLHGMKIGMKLKDRWEKYDIPVIDGKIESFIKETVSMTVPDEALGVLCGLNGLTSIEQATEVARLLSEYAKTQETAVGVKSE